MPAAERAGGRGAADVQAAIERFLKASRQPALLEPGEDVLPLLAGNFTLELRAARLTLQAWDRTRNLVRRVTAVREETRGRLELVVERFAGREGRLYLIDLATPAGAETGRRGPRRVFRERFREMLSRQFPGWKIAELSVEADLEHSLSPAYPRALIRHGGKGWAAIAAAAEPALSSGVLSFGLIWLDYLRRRERRLTIEGLAVFVAAGQERTTCLRLLFLNPAVAAFRAFTYSEQGFVAPLDPRDFGNLDTRLDLCRRPHPDLAATLEDFSELESVETIPRPDGSVSLRVHGVEFARAGADGVTFGLAERVPLREHNAAEMADLAVALARARAPEAADREHPFFRRHPEAWLESQVRSHLEQIDPSLLPEPVYNQVPAFAGGDRGVMDLLAADRAGRLAVIELKASADLHLPLQALDYWMRVKWHLDREEFSALGYFPAIELASRPPRLLLLSPALEFHPTTEAILRYFSPLVDVERIGLGLEWRKRLEIMFHLRGPEHPELSD